MTAHPNLVLVLTDDQGYGDLGCTGNPWIHTPHIDRFHEDSIRLTDFHVSPLCTPTRGAIMTGRNPLRNGAWATCWGRSVLRRSEITMADVFRSGGYRTGMFGKWHLGDNYPYRPQDRGFEHVVAHKGGGVGQTPDFWGNNYFDDTYFHNSNPVSHSGYCTDVWFDEATKFIEEHRDEPFFCYIATNAPHTPYLVEDRYARRYRGNPRIPEPEFYGMITNIDENFGRLVSRLHELGLADNTILIFMTDNGSSGGWRENDGAGYNGGMRGKKGSYYDGGHRVPFFIRWPGGALDGGRDIGDLVTHMDLLPTFAELCEIEGPDAARLDGQSVAGLLRGEGPGPGDRTVFVQYRQHTDPPRTWENAVITPRWRLVGGEELYDITTDPAQEQDLSGEHPQVVARLRAAQEKWWAEVSPGLDEYCPISVGGAENPTCLCAMDVLGDVAWGQNHILAAQKSTGRWMVDVEQAGAYRFSLRRWPEELGISIDGCVPADEAVRIAPHTPTPLVCTPITAVSARVVLFGSEHRVDLASGAVAAVVEISVHAPGVTELEAWFADDAGEEQGAYYVYAQRIAEGEALRDPDR